MCRRPRGRGGGGRSWGGGDWRMEELEMSPEWACSGGYHGTQSWRQRAAKLPGLVLDTLLGPCSWICYLNCLVYSTGFRSFQRPQRLFPALHSLMSTFIPLAASQPSLLIFSRHLTICPQEPSLPPFPDHLPAVVQKQHSNNKIRGRSSVHFLLPCVNHIEKYTERK